MLTLPIKKKWYDMILSGDKREEYREINPYYHSRLARYMRKERSSDNEPWHRCETWICFRNGYSKNSPSFRALCTVRIGEGKAEWGAEDGQEYFILEIKEIKEIKEAKSKDV